MEFYEVYCRGKPCSAFVSENSVALPSSCRWSRVLRRKINFSFGMTYRKRAKRQYRPPIPRQNIRWASKYLAKKGVRSAYMFGSGLRVPNPAHDLDIAVDLPPTVENRRKFEDAASYGIDLFLLGPLNELFSVGLDDYLYTDKGELQDLESVGACKFKVKLNEV